MLYERRIVPERESLCGPRQKKVSDGQAIGVNVLLAVATSLRERFFLDTE